MAAFAPSVSSLASPSSHALVTRRRRLAPVRAPPPPRRAGARMEAATPVDVASVASVSLPATGVSSGSLTLADVGSDLTIVYFYPRDCTPGCTTEAQDFRDFKHQLDSLGATVIGVSPDDVKSHENFTEKESINFALVSDDGTLADAFGAWKNHPVFGKVINRSTFILQNGAVVREWRGVKAKGHAAEVVAAVRDIAAK